MNCLGSNLYLQQTFRTFTLQLGYSHTAVIIQFTIAQVIIGKQIYYLVVSVRTQSFPLQ